MTILVAGQDRTRELEPRLTAAMTRRESEAKPRFLSPEISALTLREAGSDAEYLSRLLNLIRYRDAVDTLAFEIPRKPGILWGAVARVRAFLWRALRYQHDRIAFRQNLINGLFTSALEFEILQRESDLRDLRARLEVLERRLAATPPPPAGPPERAS
jgi:hypothetical protein